ncbi:Phage repressor protein C, contains Cro/C1-type HTH and peptisase s24 domains [Rhodoblastus acidophilus]|uniref:Phage repressor protein C, contains Cro/C1-type HTH and peptisase s24 domains n=2 Tax=Rhodoblastus acidophilus TaxID=1074 RepID=A0A212SBY9_RHOAC|nr:LexA family transcriptional regulator [Rhodoblastus acidophilus]PPQ35410.1 hypothetical protein CKO16_20625 [Rhodoblastus acidophilus]RAI17035.1 hypothetical protein CH337_18240 [Rhodoblastus acidophilus]SNB83046.1 Phage repressor protein C, contains Cro/C1-type HTH and peptisase s24 domains [Rhodoblastus acidophilus]
MEIERGEPVSLRAISLASGLSEWTLSKLLKKAEHSPTLETIERLSVGLQTSPIWLAFGVEAVKPDNPRGTPHNHSWLQASIPVAGLVGAGAIVEDFSDPTSWTTLETVELQGVENIQALQVCGDSQYPRFFDGDFVLFENVPRRPAELANHLAVVQAQDGRRLLKILRPIGGGDQWMLESINAAPEVTTLLAAYRYLGVVSARARQEPAPRKKSA